MPEFTFEALASTGQRSQGTLTANSEREALAQLDARGLFPIKVAPAQSAARSRFGRKIKARNISTAFSQLADLLRSGPKQFLVGHGGDQQASDRHYLNAWALAFYLAMLADLAAVAELGWIAGSGVLLCAVAHTGDSALNACAVSGALAGTLFPGWLDARTGAMYAQHPDRIDVVLQPVVKP